MLGPIEILVIAFPGNRFAGEILPALADLVDTDTISIIDGVFVRKDEDGTISYSEFEELGVNEDAMALTDVIEMINGLVSDEDVEELAADLENDSSAAILVFEHTWFKPLRDAIVSSGGVLVDTVRIPGAVVDEVLEALAEADADTD
ncbi:DUF6325 family protein [Cryobacterium sp. TMT2-23]|uniref:DUF6325 family protein n=1 Tax=Cryobacterium sp. TMT2-23 TaxID=1259252 RepID=UPI001068D8DE|nr:DUF6325 family protein [Cryobacterium sp. TMT2-23]TFD28413.1 hypothetical protein E3T32_00665 [Cryobacterium sp. TMT2-23]